MTVAELIAALQALEDQDAEVRYFDGMHPGYWDLVEEIDCAMGVVHLI